MKHSSPLASATFLLCAVAVGCVVENTTPPPAPAPTQVGTVPPPPTVSSAAANPSGTQSAIGGSASSTPSASPSATASASSSATAAPGDFYTCQLDADCVAVPKATCCNTGQKEAVLATAVDAYKASFTCPDPHPVCPMMAIIDHRVPECDNGTHKCSMVDPDKIRCGGFIRNQHKCADGWSCKVAGVPDAPGTCVKK